MDTPGRSIFPGLEYMADRPMFPRVSFVVVYEDGVPLPGPHALHAEIRELGDGLFVHWGEYLVYSASDNSDPSCNGRRYTYSRAWWLYRRHYGRWPVTGAQRGLKLEPVNFRVLDSRDEAIARDVDYTLQVIDASLAMLPADVGALKGAAVLEIGPGHNLGTALCLASLGARVTVVDLYPPAWDELYHPRLYTALHERLCSERPGWDPEPIRMVVENASHEPVLRCVAAGAEAMPTVSDASMDLTLSKRGPRALRRSPGSRSRAGPRDPPGRARGPRGGSPGSPAPESAPRVPADVRRPLREPIRGATRRVRQPLPSLRG